MPLQAWGMRVQIVVPDKTDTVRADIPHHLVAELTDITLQPDHIPVFRPDLV